MRVVEVVIGSNTNHEEFELAEQFILLEPSDHFGLEGTIGQARPIERILNEYLPFSNSTKRNNTWTNDLHSIYNNRFYIQQNQIPSSYMYLTLA
jgi:hypothetical protein